MSIVNQTYGHIFIHVPKAAGTSMESCPWVGGNGHRTAVQLGLWPAGISCYWSWGFVRHPLDRLVSAYCGLRWNRNHFTPDIDSMTFRQYVRYMHEEGTLRKYPQTRPQVDFLCADGQVLVDFVGRFESLQSDWEYVCRQVLGRQSRAFCEDTGRVRLPIWRIQYGDAVLQATAVRDHGLLQPTYLRRFEHRWVL